MKSYLVHHGILGMHWGIRRYQNPDGTRTEEGKEHDSEEAKKKAKIKKALIIGGVAVGGVLAVYGGLKLHDYIRSKKDVTSILEPWYKKNAEKVKIDQLEVYKKDFYQYFSDDFKNSNAQARYMDEIERGRKKAKELTKELFNYKNKYRMAKIKDRLSPSLFGSRTQFMIAPLEMWKNLHS